MQAGRIVITNEGVWINPLTDDKGNIMIDDKKLENSLNGVRKVNGIYLLDGDTSFVPYGSFERGVQEHGKFLEGELARGLVHASGKKADTLSPIANDTEYPKGVNVWGFDSVKKPVVRVVGLYSFRVVGLYSFRVLGDGRLDVSGNGWLDDLYGCAFGNLVSPVSARANAKK
ncbi:MAG TPA: hypothetical protein VI387_12845 [Candidatus Brocadiales bacterium]|nr:hypothetical protein [Candidatus Brocadiales bacterium]